MLDIVFGIGGTSSRKYGTNWVQDFVESFDSSSGSRKSIKKFVHGPDHVVSGSDSGEIRNKAFRTISDIIIKETALDKDWAKTTGAQFDKVVRIWLVGHSRGGHIAIDLAKSFPSVHFLGLYDAVDRTLELGNTSAVPQNVTNVYHALRNPVLASRYTFGNTGLRGLAKENTKYFLTSHGGVGSPISANKRSGKKGLFDDISCTNPRYHSRYETQGAEYSPRMPRLLKRGLSTVDQKFWELLKNGKNKKAQEHLNAVCRRGSLDARGWMRQNARNHGASFNN